MTRNEQGADTSEPRDSDEPDAREPGARAVSTHDEQAQQVLARVTHEREPRWRIRLRGRWLLLAYAVALAAVTALAFAAHSNTLLPGDLPGARELQENTSPIIFGLMYVISLLGFPVQSAVIVAFALIILWLLRLRLEALFLALSLLADVLGAILKMVVGRHRPTPNLVNVFQQIQQPSFPSGHTLHYTVFYGFLLFIIVTNFKSSWPRNAIATVFALLILLVGPSRVYLGEHWPTDVIGGYLIGGLCLVPLIAGYLWAKDHIVVTASPPWIHRIPPPIQPVAPGEH